MITYQITIVSKNPKALKLFVLFCCQNKKKSFNLKTTFYKIKNKKKIITVLKSPHVNKTAQSQLEYRIFSTKMLISLQNATQYLVFLKKIKAKLFPEIKMKIKFIIDKQNYFQTQNQALHPKKFTINTLTYHANQKISLQQNLNVSNKKNLTYIKIFDCFGELNLMQNLRVT